MVLNKILVFLSVLVLVSACAAPKQEVTKRYFWPPLSDDPKIEYIGFYQTDYDVKKTNIGVLEKAIFGLERPTALFSQPFDIFAGDKGQFFVTEPALGFVKVINYATTNIGYLKDKVGDRKFFKQPLGVTGDTADNIYVVDSIGQKISIFTSDFYLVTEWEGPHFIRPVSIAVDDLRQRAYVADPGQHKVLVLSQKDGGLISSIGGHGTQDNQFNFPIDVDLDRDGNLYVLDSLNARVKVFNPSGEFLRSFGERGTALGSFQLPKGLAVSPSGYVYVTDSMGHRFVIFDLQGRYLLTIGGKFEASEGSVSPGGLYLPQGLDVDSGGMIWVVDTLNRMVHRFQYLTSDYLQENPILPGQAVDPFKLRNFAD